MQINKNLKINCSGIYPYLYSFMSLVMPKTSTAKANSHLPKGVTAIPNNGRTKRTPIKVTIHALDFIFDYLLLIKYAL